MASDPNASTPREPPSAGPGIALDSFNFARAAKVFALLLFLLPWVTVSCGQAPIATMSGYELATGTVTVHNPMTGQAEHPPGSQGPDIPVLVAALLIMAALVLGFVLRRALATLVGIAGSAAAAALISYTVWVRIPSETHATPPPGGEGTGMFNEQQIAELIRVEVSSGYWLTICALIAAILLNWLARNRAT
jgi:hypothetical protein